LVEEGEEGKDQPNLRMKLEVPLQVCHVKVFSMELAISFFYHCDCTPVSGENNKMSLDFD
jgi:hypothetical protein